MNKSIVDNVLVRSLNLKMFNTDARKMALHLEKEILHVVLVYY